MFPHRLTDTRAFDIARAMLDGFNRHYRLFREASAAAKARFEAADWHGQQRAQALRIEFYDQRVAESAQRLRQEFDVDSLSMDSWQQVKLHYIGLLTDHHQPELAETFFNSVTVKLLHRSYFRNDFIFVRPAVSTEYIEDEAARRAAHLPRLLPDARDAARDAASAWCTTSSSQCEFEDLGRDIDDVLRALGEHIGLPVATGRCAPTSRSRCCPRCSIATRAPTWWARSSTATPRCRSRCPSCMATRGRLVIDTAMFSEDELLILFSFARAYFMVDMEVPSAYVQFLRSLMPRKPRTEIYNALGLQKHGKNLFYRDFLAHQRHSSDAFRIAPGIKGMVMLVFDLPSFPYVFKVIKDFYPPQKDTTREQIKGKYLLVKQHDRVGRMADTLEYSNVAFPRARFEPELIAELKHFCPSLVEDDGDALVIRHVYIERRMIPLNIYLHEGTPEQIEQAVVEYGNAIKDLVAANIFPGDMLFKNFGVTRHGKVVFYDYDEIEYLTDCNFRRVPAPRNEEDEMSGEIWYSVGPKDVFPETFAPFLLGNPAVREVFMKHHADLLDAGFWQGHKERILAGHVHDVFPYEPHKRFAQIRAQRAPAPPAPLAAGT